MPSHEFPFIAGVDEGPSAKILPMPRLRRALNVRSVRTGELSKIRGMAAVGTASIDANSAELIGPVQLFTHGEQLVAAGETSLFTLSEAASPSKWEEIEDGVQATLTAKQVLGHYGHRDIVAYACGAIAGFAVYAWFTAKYDADEVDTYELHVMTVDRVTGAGTAATLVTIAGTSSETINPCVRVIPLGSKVTVFWAETVSSVNRIRYLDITSATSGPYLPTDNGTNLIDGGIWGTPQFFDVAPHGSGYVVSYSNGTGILTGRYNSSHALQATAAAIAFTGTLPRVGVVGNMTDGDASIHMSVVTDNGDNTSRIQVFGLSDAIATITTYTDASEPECISIACGEFDNTRSQMVYGTEDEGVRLKYFAGGSLATQSSKIPNTYVCGKPIGRNGRSFFAVQYKTSRPNSVACLVRIDPGFLGISFVNPHPEVSLNRGRAVDVLGTFNVAGEGGGYGDQSGSVMWLDDELTVCVPAVDRFSGPITAAGVSDPAENPTGTSVETGSVTEVTTNVVERVGVDAWTFSFGDRSRYQSAKVGGYTFLGGGSVLAFDGKRCVELGFISYPDVQDTDLTAATSGGQMDDGDYTYAFVWEWHDYLGNRHQSAAKFCQVTLTGGGGSGKVTITAPPGLPLTLKQWRTYGNDSRPIVFAIYRSKSSLEDLEGGTATMHRLEGDGVAPFLENDPTEVSSIGEYVDTYDSDTILLVTRELLYTSSLGAGELDNVPPPPARHIVAHDGRLFGIDDSNPRQIWYTKQSFEGSAPAWNETLIIPLEEEATRLASQDGNLLVFFASGTSTVIGRPADNTGASTGYEPPQKLSTEVGCPTAYARSVCPTPAGTFFRNERGIQLLPRGGAAAEFVGKAIQDTLTTYPVITSVCHVPAENSVLFACVTSEAVAATGIVLAFDYALGQWFQREYRAAPISSMAIHRGNLAVGVYSSASAATVWREDSGWDDATGAYVGVVIETGDIRLGGFAGGQTVNFVTVLGSRRGTCQLQIREQVDLATSYSTAVTFALTTAEAELLRRYQTKVRKSTRLRLELAEVVSGSTVDTEGLAWTGLLLEGAALSGGARLASARQG
jgi:hypothetical protein